MPIIVKRPLAFEDIADIWAYIAEDSESRADAFIDSIDCVRHIKRRNHDRKNTRTMQRTAADGAGFGPCSRIHAHESGSVGEKLTKTEEYAGFGCDGQNISPELRWSNPPAGTKSFALTMFDPDARSGAGWWHWLIFDIPAGSRTLVRDAGNPDRKLAPVGSVQSLTGFGKSGFGGPCPPKGDKPHAYVFTIYALDTAKLDADEMNLPPEVMAEIQKHSLGKASISSYYQR